MDNKMIILENAMWKAVYENAVRVEKDIDDLIKRGLEEEEESLIEKILNFFIK